MNIAFSIVLLLLTSILVHSQESSETSRSLHSIVDPSNEIDDFEAHFELAKLFSHSSKNNEKAFKEYDFILRQNSNDPRIWLEVSRLYIQQKRFNEALEILEQLVEQGVLNFNFPSQTPQIEPTISHPTLVSVGEFISDDQTKLEIARLLSHDEERLDEAILIYLFLIDKSSNDPTLLLEISRIYIRQKKYYTALSYLYYAIEIDPNNSDLLVEAAHAELGLNHAYRSHHLLLRALTITENPEPILIDLASVYMLVGSFYKAEIIYENALMSKPESLDLTLKLAWVLVSAQRYEEAEGMYRCLLLNHINHPKVLEALVTLKILEMDFDAALDFVEDLLMCFPENPTYIQLKAEILFKKADYVDALHEFDRLSNHLKFSTLALIGMGRAYIKLGCRLESEECFQKAYDQNPSSIEAQFYQAGLEVSNEEYIQQIIDQTQSPEDLIKWANVYSENGMGGILEFYEKALIIDPEFFPSQNGLAEALSSHYKYDEALDIYLSILDSFPENSKIMIAVARVLSWGKDYENSMYWYDRVIDLNQSDPVPQREKARVAAWGKYFNKSMQYYRKLLNPPVDRLLLNALQEDGQGFCHTSSLSIPLTSLSDCVSNGSIYTGYEEFCDYIKNASLDCSDNEKGRIDEILCTYFPLYRIQKNIKLESDAKAYDWQTYYLHALPIYRKLADFNPGNTEGLYGYAQDYCNIGQCTISRSLYEHLLNLDPNSKLFTMALERNLMRTQPLVQGNYSYWAERGSGQFANSQISRQQFDEVVEFSPRCNQHMRFIQSEWLEYPFFKDQYYPAEGQKFEIDQIFNNYVQAFASVSYKNYFHQFPSRFSCLGTLWLNLFDYGKIGLGFEKKNEIYNYFTLKQGTQANIPWVTLRATSHSWNIETTYRHLSYNDHNDEDHINVLASYVFVEDPTVFKVIMNANYRNTTHLTKLIINSKGELVNIIHPYWTPKDYYSGSMTFEFRYNYAWFTYCEAPQRYVDIKLTGEDDTAHNPSFELILNWKHECMNHWGFEFTGLYHRSKLWNADGCWTQIYYRF